MQPEKKQLEILLMDYFRECYIDFPKGLVSPSESPDFLVKMKSKNILGIELTRLNPGNAAKPDDVRLKTIEFREQLLQMALDIFQGKCNLNLFVKILFSENQPILPERKISVAVQVANLIFNAVKVRNENSFFKESLPKKQLPQGIEDILIAHHPKLEISVWERCNNLGVSNDVVDDIKMAIHKKDEKLRLYQKNHLNFYWLLITTDHLRGVKSFNLPNKIMNHKFHSRFQHVFLFDLIKSKVYQLV